MQILKTCKSHGVTVTKFVSGAMVLAAISTPATIPPITDSFYLANSQGADLRSRLPAGKSDVALRVAIFPTAVQLPSNTTSDSTKAVWDAARQCAVASDAFLESQYLWHLVRSSTAMSLQLFEAYNAGVPEVRAMLSTLASAA